MQTDALPGRFLDALALLRPRAVRAHGSPAGGDRQEGRGDLDPIAVPPERPGPTAAPRVVAPHRRLRDAPPAAKPHCGCLAPATLADPGRAHLTWAHG
ncbi:hypothetical protein [Streptomyces misionensis]|uniref:hypothetical protein n=1 Tax=Streptomyces misionensis TaxID=67331 RepID=UPI0036C44BCB